jgi:Polyketide cyclase / dehydrase and lipid transport
MELTRYRFLTTWRLDAPLDAVYEAIHGVERWPEWWRGVESVERLDGGNGDGVGSVYRQRWRSVLPYSIVFDVETTRVEPLVALEGRASGGLAGTGRWSFRNDGAAIVTYAWDVRTTRPWMRLASPVARPVFTWSHNTVMRWGGESLASLLGARLLT